MSITTSKPRRASLQHLVAAAASDGHFPTNCASIRWPSSEVRFGIGDDDYVAAPKMPAATFAGGEFVEMRTEQRRASANFPFGGTPLPAVDNVPPFRAPFRPPERRRLASQPALLIPQMHPNVVAAAHSSHIPTSGLANPTATHILPSFLPFRCDEHSEDRMPNGVATPPVLPPTSALSGNPMYSAAARLQRRSQPSVLAQIPVHEMNALAAALRHSQPMLCADGDLPHYIVDAGRSPHFGSNGRIAVAYGSNCSTPHGSSAFIHHDYGSPLGGYSSPNGRFNGSPIRGGVRNRGSNDSIQSAHNGSLSRLPQLLADGSPNGYATPTNGAATPNGRQLPRCPQSVPRFPVTSSPPSRQFVAHPQPQSPTSRGSPTMQRKLARAAERRILQRAPQSDLAYRFQRHHQNEMAAAGVYDPQHDGSPEVDPVYLALKQATGKYGSRRGSSSNQFDSATPSPRNLSQVSLQDSGYAEATGSHGHLLGSTPQLHQSGSQPPPNAFANGSSVAAPRRAPKLNKQMKSLSLDCADAPPPVQSAMRSSPFKSKPIRSARGFATSGETSDWERSVSPSVPSPRRLPSQPIQSVTAVAAAVQQQPQQQTTGATPSTAPPTPAATANSAPAGKVYLGTHIVTHEYNPPDGSFALYLGDRLHIVDNGDPDWLHGFRTNDRTQQLITFPSTCVASVQPTEQPMRLVQNCHIAEAKLRLYRDQVVFAQADTMREDNKVLVRNERGTMAYCPLQYLMLL